MMNIEQVLKETSAVITGDNGTKLFWDKIKILYGGGWVVGRHNGQNGRKSAFTVFYDGEDFQEALQVFTERESEDEDELSQIYGHSAPKPETKKTGYRKVINQNPPPCC